MQREGRAMEWHTSGAHQAAVPTGEEFNTTVHFAGIPEPFVTERNQRAPNDGRTKRTRHLERISLELGQPKVGKFGREVFIQLEPDSEQDGGERSGGGGGGEREYRERTRTLPLLMSRW